MVDKAIDFSTKPATTLPLRTPMNANILTVNTENLKVDYESVTYFDILLEQQASLLEVQREQTT